MKCTFGLQLDVVLFQGTV